MPDAAGRPRAGSWWQCVVLDPAGEPTRFVTVQSARYPDGMRVRLSEELARVQIGNDALCVMPYDEHGRVAALHVQPWVAPKAPGLWFAELRNSNATPPTVALLAFVHPCCPPGTLVDEAAAAGLPVQSADQVAALRWYPATGEVDEVYVQPTWRRRHIASLLLAAGGSLSVARSWARLWGDGQRTLLGEQLRNASSWRHRAADLTNVSPPMTPGEA